MIKKVSIFVLILFSLVTKAALSDILEELDEKTDVSRLEYSLDKLLPKLEKAMSNEPFFGIEKESITIQCSYTVVSEETLIGLQCSFSSNDKSIQNRPGPKLEDYISRTADRLAKNILIFVFSNFGEPNKLNFQNMNILHLATGRLFMKEFDWWDESLDSERLRVGKAMAKILDIFIRVDFESHEYIYRYSIDDPYDLSHPTTFPNKVLWRKIVGADIIISGGKPTEKSE